MISILVVTQENPTGLNYHRQLIPHAHLDRNYGIEYRIDMTYNINTFTENDLSNFDIVTFLRIISEKDDTIEIINKCKRAGCKVIIDIDDYWKLHKHHELMDIYIKKDYQKKCLDGLVNADYVTTTTEIFANKIREYNKNVIVLPNSIDEFEPQFKREPISSDLLRFGWIGGIFHIPDIRLMYEGFKQVNKADASKFQLCLGGFGNNAQYQFIEKIYTDNYRSLKDKEYIHYLKSYTDDNNDEMSISQPYKRLYGTDVFNYARLYNSIDIALIPLEANAFNRYKSQIKIIEAGYFKKPVIVSNVEPYTIDCTKDNSILINPDKRNSGWGVALKSIIRNPEKVKDKGEALHELVMSKYIMDVVNKIRHEFYKSII